MKYKYLIDLDPEQVAYLVRQDIQWHLANCDLEDKDRRALEIVVDYYGGSVCKEELKVFYETNRDI